MKIVKKLLSNIFNVAAVLGFVLAFASIIAIFVASYKFVDTVSATDNSAQAMSILSESLQSLNLVDSIQRDFSKAQVPKLCQIICAPSKFDFRSAEGKSRENPVVYLRDFYDHEGTKAFNDPKFRLALETSMVYSDFLSTSSRKALLEIGQVANRADQMSVTDKILMSAKLPIMALQVGAQVATRIGDAQDRANRASDLNSLRQSCSRAKPKDIVRECEAL